MSTSPEAAAPVSTVTKWLILLIASIGFAFDIYELLMLPLVLRPALTELTGYLPGSPEFGVWAGRLFYIPAFAGGLFGLLGGYLTDRLGRRRVLTWSIVLYAVSAFASGFSTSVEMLLVFRCTTFIGVCVEFVAAVAWLAELFPDPEQRERALGYSQAFSSVGGLLVAGANSLAITYATSLPAIQVPEFLQDFAHDMQAHHFAMIGVGALGVLMLLLFLALRQAGSGLLCLVLAGVVIGLIQLFAADSGMVSLGLGTIDPRHQHEPWRYTLMSGLIPAIPLIIIRPFLPESPVWARKKAAGTLKRPSIRELFAPELRKTTLVTTILFACSYGAAFGAIQQIPQIVPGLKNVREEAKGLPVPKQKALEQRVAADYTKMQEIGGLVGRFLLAFLAIRIVSRRWLLRMFQVPGLFVVPVVFFVFLTIDNQTFFTLDLSWLGIGELPVTTVTLGVFLAGLFTVAQFSFWGNYLPRVYPVHLRGTGESFAANIGGRMIGTSFAWVTSTLAVQSFWDQSLSPPMRLAYTAAGVALFVYVVGVLTSFFLPEPKEEELPE